jgi:phosphonoacetaldehyde hydrolase
MLWKVLVELGVWPAHACVKVDDAEVGIEEGRNAGVWTVGVAASGNAVGLSFEAYQALSPEDRQDRLAIATRSLTAAGADFVIPTVAELLTVLSQIEQRLADGGRPGAA